MGKNALTERIHNDLKSAMKERDSLRISTLRMLLSELKNEQLKERGELEEEKEIAVLGSYARKRKESIKEFEKGGREDLAESERKELEIVMAYLPQQMGAEEIEAELRRIIDETGASGPGDIGRIMGAMMGRFKGRVEGNEVKRIALELLGG
jgi:uncharacterized protein YqeY